MVKFGGPGRKKQCCRFIKCIQECSLSLENTYMTSKELENTNGQEKSVEEHSLIFLLRCANVD